MEAIFDEIEQEAAAYFKEEKDKEEKARVDRIWLMREYNKLKSCVTDMNRLMKEYSQDNSRVTDMKRMKVKQEASAARKALKLFRQEHNM